MPQIRLNIFQRLTRQWDTLHPYNASQLMQLAGVPNLGRIEEAWRSALHELGLGAIHCTRGGYRYVPLDGSTAAVYQPPAGTKLESYLTDEMNRPFVPTSPGARASPFRPFVLPVNGTHYLGIVYHHWIADSVSIRLLLREWFLRLYDPTRARRSSLPVASTGYWRLFGPDAAGWDLAGGLLDVFRWSSRLKRARRVENKSFPQLQTRFTLHSLPDGLADRLLPIARARGATLNDLFLAGMAVACDRHIAAPPNRRRADLALGVIVDLRSRAAENLEESFGLFLGFTNVLCGFEDLHDWEQLVASIAAQNRKHKRADTAESSMLRMFGGVATGHLLPRQKLLEFYRKRLPLAAGISNVNLNPTWVNQYHPSPILNYIRVSPTGPMLPLVFTPTTLGKSMHFGLTHRVSVIPGEVAESAASCFVDCLANLV